MAQPKDFGFGQDEQMVRDAAAKFLAENAPVAKLRTLVAGDPHAFVAGAAATPAAFDQAAWNKVVELGWLAMPVPERAGGLGMKMVGIAGLLEEVGRAAFPAPLLATYAAAFALREANTKEADAYLAKIAEGTTATLALADSDGAFYPAFASVSADAAGNLSGTAHFVQDAAKAARFVVAAKGAKGVGLYVVEADAKGLTLTADRIIDATRDQARVSFDKVKAVEVAAAPAGGEALTRALPAIWTAVAADLVGASEWLLQTTVEYAKVREQFDKPIGTFQAVKHPLVNVMVQNDFARSHLYNAACAVDTEPENAEKFARMAKAQASDAGAFAADRAVQLHGGIGFTWECDVHLFFKRNKHNEALYGDGRHHRRKLAELVLG